MTDVSVALCTFQGERFVSEQLASIARQTLPPAEVVVCDDGSTDGTIDAIERFAASAAFPVRVHVNPDRLGVAANFSRAISLCEGSVVALSDQDDVWLPAKLERQVAVLRDRPAVGAVFSDAELVDRSLRPLGRSLFEATGFSPRRQRRFRGGALELLLSRPVVCGASLAFRSSFRDLVLPIPTTGLHDQWLAVLLSAVSRVEALPEPLLHYRQHGANQIGAPAARARSKLSRRRSKGVYGDEVGHFRAMAERLAAQEPTPSIRSAIELIERKTSHLEFRYGLARHRAIPVLTELMRGRYHRYSRGLDSAGYDLLFRGRDPG